MCFYYQDSKSSDRDYSGGDDEKDQMGEEWQTTLELNFKGTVFDWKYNIDISVNLENDDELDLSLDKYVLTKDIDAFLVQKVGSRRRCLYSINPGL